MQSIISLHGISEEQTKLYSGHCILPVNPSILVKVVLSPGHTTLDEPIFIFISFLNFLHSISYQILFKSGIFEIVEGTSELSKHNELLPITSFIEEYNFCPYWQFPG